MLLRGAKRRGNLCKTPTSPFRLLGITNRLSSGDLCLRGLGQLGEASGIVHSDIGEHLAVQIDTGFLQTEHQLAVGQSVQTGCSIDAGDPQRAVLSILLLAAGIGIA